MMWIPITSTAVTFLFGWLISLGFEPPGPEIRALVFSRQPQPISEWEHVTVNANT
jgi:hypothetical protein